MNALLLQTLALMVPAFFIGAALACMLRRAITPAREATYTPVRAQPAPVEPLPQYAERNAAAAPSAAVNKFDQALRPVEPRPAPPPPPAAPPTVKAAPVPAAPAPAPAAPAAAAPAAVPVAPRPTPPAAPAATPLAPRPAAPTAPVAATAEKIASAAAAMAAASAAVAAQASAAAKPATPPPAAPASTVVEPPARAAVVASPAPAAPDDLTRISAIDVPLSAQLAKLGVTRFSQIAGWRKPDVDKISQAFGFQGRIEQENWIEQAQILAGGGETSYSARRAKPAAPAPVVRAPAPAAVVPAPAVAASGPAAVPSAPRVEERAAFAQPTTPPTPARPPVSPAVRVPPASVAVQPAAPAATPPAAVRPSVAPKDAAISAAAAAAAAAAATAVSGTPPPPTPAPAAATPTPATAIRPAIAPSRDVLQRIGSISAELEKLLFSQGITRFTQIASWGTGDIERFDRLLGSQGRIARENWVEQAQILAKGGDTVHSREYDRRTTAPATPPQPAAAPAAVVRPKSITEAIRANAAAASQSASAPAGRPNISGLRSVRSEAYTSATDAATAAAAAAAASSGSAKVVRSAEIDDLKRIRGIGVLIEKRLNQIGIVNYGQIAEWTTDDIDRVSATLDFKGRIERENWVEQARILAAGGQTEFSRRVDRGEVETSKPRPA